MKLKPTTSFLAPNKLAVVPFHKEFATDCPLDIGVSFCGIFTPPSFAQTAEILLDGVGVGLGEGVGVGLGVGEGVGLGEGVGEGLGEGVGEGFLHCRFSA